MDDPRQRHGLLDDAGMELARDWSARWPGVHDEEAFEKAWHSLHGPSRVGWHELIREAERLGSAIGKREADSARLESAMADFAPVLAQLREAAEAAGTAPTLKRRFRVLTTADCIASRPRGYVVKNALAPADLALLYGPPGAGKSALAPYLAHAVSTGRGVFGRRVRTVPVLYVAAEDGHGMRDRLRALVGGHGHAPGLFLIADSINLSDATDVAALQEEIRACGAGLVIVDTLAAAFPGLRENEAEDMGRAVAALRALSVPTNAAVLAVHHEAKHGGSGPRGHSILNGAADVTFKVEPPAERGGPRRVSLGKNRNGPSDMEWAFMVTGALIGLDEDREPLTAALASEVAAVRHGLRTKLPKQAAAALGFLRDLIVERGETLPQARGFPGKGARGVREADWREECQRRGLSGTGYSRCPQEGVLSGARWASGAGANRHLRWLGLDEDAHLGR